MNFARWIEDRRRQRSELPQNVLHLFTNITTGNIDSMQISRLLIRGGFWRGFSVPYGTLYLTLDRLVREGKLEKTFVDGRYIYNLPSETKV